MIRRLALAGAVLGATVYWANCSYNPPRVEAEPDWNSFFAGCFTGQITEPAGAGRLTVVLIDPGPDDNLSLTGCLQTETTITVDATLVGMVQELREEAILTAMPTNGRPSFTIQVVRAPAGDAAAETADVRRDTGQAPFTTALDLPRCAPALDCAALGITLPFLPGGGGP